MRLRLLCDANPMAYGASSALMAVLDELCSSDVEATALAGSTAGEFFSTEPQISRRLEIDQKDTAAVAAALRRGGYHAALVVSNQSNLEMYLSAKIPVFFVDILYWYGPERTGRVWREAEACFVEAFPANAERLASAGRDGLAPRVVGPLIRAMGDLTRPRCGPLLVNIGGARNRWIRPGLNSSYVATILDVIEQLREVLPCREVLVAAGEEAVASVAGMVPTSFEVRRLAHREYLKALIETPLLITAPGLNAVFEALHAQVPFVFLPPQNASQVEQLAIYEEFDLVDPGLNLPEIVPSVPCAGAGVDEAAMTSHVLEALEVVRGSTPAQQRIVSHLRNQLAAVNAPRRIGAREAFCRVVGPPGGAHIARHILDWWRSRA